MRLYDELMAARGSLMDELMHGAVSVLCGYLARAQCFQMSNQVADVCANVCRSKPSSILSALDLTRAPYPYTWIEWGATRPYAIENDKPIPNRLGALLYTDDAGAKGQFMLAWIHKDPEPGLSLCPLGLIFDWDSTSTEPVIVQFAESLGMRHLIDMRERTRKLSQEPITGRWEKHNRTPEEVDAIMQLELRAELIPLDFCSEFLVKANILPGTPMYESYCNDLAGELPFIEAFLLLLNSRNSIVEQKRDDFSRLNRARAKNRKPPLKEFITTNVRLNRVQSNKLNTTADRETARAHLVRGHFKVRKSGVYWWNAFPRGQGAVPARREYHVR